MSLLGTQVYANPDTPLWVSSSGDTINGNLTVTGSVSTGTGVATIEGGGLGGFEVLTSGGAQTLRLQHITGRSILQTNDPLYFNQIGTAQGNTYFQTSVFGANADLLNVGGTLATQKLSVATGGAAPSCGSGAILVGQTNVVIPTTVVTANSIILVSHSGAAAAGPGNGAAQGGLTVNPALIVPGVSFRVDLVDPTTGIAVAASVVNSEFNYLIIN